MAKQSLPPESAAQLRAIAERFRDLHKRCWPGEGPLAGYYQMRFAAEKPALDAEYSSLIGVALHLLPASCDVTKGWPAFVRQSTRKALPESLRNGAAWESACALDAWLDGQGAASGDGSIALALDAWPEGGGVDGSRTKAPGGRPREWDALWEMIQAADQETPKPKDRVIARRYNSHFANVIGKGKRKRATVDIVRNVRYERTKRNRE